eukprot:jgi/Mesen1/5210/ME000258S04315
MSTSMFSYLYEACATALYSYGNFLYPLAAYLAWHYLKYGSNNGPAVWPVVGSLPGLLCNISTVHDWCLSHIQRHGTWRLVIPSLTIHVTADPRNVEHVLKGNFQNYPKGADLRKIFNELLGFSIFNSDGEEWRAQQAIACHTFTGREVQGIAHTCVGAELAEQLLPFLADAARSGETVDLQDLSLRVAADCISRISLGVDPGCVRPGLPEVPFARNLDTATSAIYSRFVLPPVLWKVGRLLRIGSEYTLHRAVEELHEFAMSGVLHLRSRGQERSQEESQKQSQEQSQGGEQRQEQGPGQKRVGGVGGSVADGGSSKTDGGIDNVTAGDAGGQDLLSRYMHDRARAGLESSDLYLRDMALNLIVAGRDTTGVTLTWFFWAISQHPEVEAAILRELRDVRKRRGRSRHLAHRRARDSPLARDSRVALQLQPEAGEAGEAERHTPSAPPPAPPPPPSSPLPTGRSPLAPLALASCPHPEDEEADDEEEEEEGKEGEEGEGEEEGGWGVFALEELTKMQYLQAALWESMRLFPALPVNIKHVAEDDELPDGTRVRAGSKLCYYLYAMARSESLWGPECGEFRPARWLKDGLFSPASPFVHPIFNGGPRHCLGKGIALLELKAVAAGVLSLFRFQVVPGHQVHYMPELTLMIRGGLPVTVHRRSRPGLGSEGGSRSGLRSDGRFRSHVGRVGSEEGQSAARGAALGVEGAVVPEE